jgi:uncharacterized phage-like protein YoqJ
MDWIIIAGFFAVILCFMWLVISLRKAYEDEMWEMRSGFNEERESWYKERKELLDRIQAPSFAEYKQAEVKVIKAQKEEPQERIELL